VPSPFVCLFARAPRESLLFGIGKSYSLLQRAYIHFFSSTKELLSTLYTTKERGKIEVKGKGEMTTFWLESRANRQPPPKSEVEATL